MKVNQIQRDMGRGKAFMETYISHIIRILLEFCQLFWVDNWHRFIFFFPRLKLKAERSKR